MKNGRFMIGLVGVALVVTWLVWTGVSDTMMYFLTPSELMARVEQDPTFRDVGVKVGGKMVPGSYAKGDGAMLHRFQVGDMENLSASFPVEYEGTLPDTFNPSMDVDVVVEGRFRQDGVFVATTVLTKCGSRYEAMEPVQGSAT